MEGKGSGIYTVASNGKAHDYIELLLEEEDEELTFKGRRGSNIWAFSRSLC